MTAKWWQKQKGLFLCTNIQESVKGLGKYYKSEFIQLCWLHYQFFASYSEEYLKPSRRSTMELFCVTFFVKKLHRRCPTGFQMRL